MLSVFFRFISHIPISYQSSIVYIIQMQTSHFSIVEWLSPLGVCFGIRLKKNWAMRPEELNLGFFVFVFFFTVYVNPPFWR